MCSETGCTNTQAVGGGPWSSEDSAQCDILGWCSMPQYAGSVLTVTLDSEGDGDGVLTKQVSTGMCEGRSP